MSYFATPEGEQGGWPQEVAAGPSGLTTGDWLKKWVRAYGGITYFRGKEVPAKWHRTKRYEPQERDIVTFCGERFPIALGCDDRNTNPPVPTRCEKCAMWAK